MNSEENADEATGDVSCKRENSPHFGTREPCPDNEAHGFEMVRAESTHQVVKQSGPGFFSKFQNFVARICGSPDIPQGSFVDVEEGDYPKEVIYKQAVARHSTQPYRVKFSHPTRRICGIAVTPKDKNAAFPEVEILEGGVGHNFVHICLNPLTQHYWACGVQILSRMDVN